MFRFTTMALTIAAFASPAFAGNEGSWREGQYLCVAARTVEQTEPRHQYVIITGESDECARNCEAAKNCYGYTYIRQRQPEPHGTRACRLIKIEVPLRTVEQAPTSDGSVHTCLKRRFN